MRVYMERDNAPKNKERIFKLEKFKTIAKIILTLLKIAYI